MKLLTEIKIESLPVRISLNDRIMVLGSCFADNIGAKMLESGFNVCINPFGTLYNPSSIVSAMEHLESGSHFEDKDCIEMGAGAGLVCSFNHHTSFARKSREEFLKNANTVLDEAHSFWADCNKMIITLGTAFVWQRNGVTVSNCLKRPAAEFCHKMLSMEEIGRSIQKMKSYEKDIVFTVSPIRHLSDGAHANTLSKASLHLAVSAAADMHSAYFPAYEILTDELRDYRFYAEDLVHPSPAAVGYIWERFIDAAIPSEERQTLNMNVKASRRGHHVEMH